MDITGKRMVITGGASGIGRATAIMCAARGAKVIVADVNHRDADRCIENIHGTGGEAWYVKTDVSREDDVRSLVESAERLKGGIDVLVAASGIARDALVPVDELLADAWDETIRVNLRGAFLLTKFVVPAMKRAGGGVIVMIASGAGVKRPSSMVAYGASKGGVNGLAMTLEPALAIDGIRINVLRPGEIATPLKLHNIDQQFQITGDSAQQDETTSRLGEPDGVANVIAFLVSDNADYVRGSVFTR